MIQDYAKNGVDSHFTIVVTNEDYSSKAGKQVIQVHWCNTDSVDMTKLDVDEERLDQDMDFIFNLFNKLEKYDPKNIRKYNFRLLLFGN